jgi:hypothetical protein
MGGGKMRELKNFEFDLQKMINVSKAMFKLLEDRNMPETVILSNVKRVVIPQATRFVEEFRPVFNIPDSPDNSIVKFEDFNFHRVVMMENPNSINIYAGMRGILGFEVILIFPQIYARILREEESVMFSDYQFLVDNLPFNLEGKKDQVWFNVSIATHWVVSRLITVLTLIYNLCDLNDEVKIEGGKGQNERAKEYVYRVIEKVKGMGGNFLEVLDNLQFVGALIL